MKKNKSNNGLHFKRKGSFKLISLYVAVLICFITGIAGAEVALKINQPIDGSTVEKEEFVQVTGTASAIGGEALDVMLVVDDSSSLQLTDPSNWRNSAIHDLIISLPDDADISIGMVRFSSDQESKVAVGLSMIQDSRNQFDPALDDMKREERLTAIGTGINIAKEELLSKGRSAASKVIVVFTDGNYNDGLDPVTQATNALQAGIRVNVVTLSSASCPSLPAPFQGACTGAIAELNITLNEAIAEAGGGSHFSVETHEELVAYLGSPRIVEMDRVEIINETNQRKANGTTFVSGSFTAQVSIDEGQNIILVTGYGEDGASAEARVTVTREGTPTSDEELPAPVKLRPQIIAAGFDPMLIDYTTTQFKVLAMVREGSVRVQDVSLTDNIGNLNMAMTKAGMLSNGDLIYEMIIPIDRGDAFSLPGIFGPDPGQFNIKVRDIAQQEHRFPIFEYGNNIPLTTSNAPTTADEYNPDACKRLLPQVIMGGFDPPLLDWDESNAGIIAVVRNGARPVYDVALSMGSALMQAMDLIETLPNGDMLYKSTLTFQRGAFPASSFRDFWGANDAQFMIRVRDDAMQEHKFPDLRRSNYPSMGDDKCWCDR